MAQSIFQMTSTPEDMHLQLDELALQLLMLCQNLVDTKLLLEKFTKEGHINLAQSRYAMGGPASVSGLALHIQLYQNFTYFSFSKCEKSTFVEILFKSVTQLISVYKIWNGYISY